MSKNKRGSGMQDNVFTHFFGENRLAFNPAMNRETAIYNMLSRKMLDLSANRFKWSDLPDSVDERFLEMTLLFNALSVFYYDEEYEVHLAVRANNSGFVNMLDNPTSFTVMGPGVALPTNGSDVPVGIYNKTLSAFDPVRHFNAAFSDEERKRKGVPIWANYTRSPDIDLIRIYATRLAWLDRTLEINSKNARRNKVLKGTDTTQLSMANFARQADNGEDTIMVTGAMQDMEFIEALDLGIDPRSYEALALLRTRVWNEAMGLLGIDNANQDKKERLVAAEVGANDSQTDSMRYVNLNARQQAAEVINKVFGLEVSVDYRAELEAKESQEEVKETEEEEVKEADNGDIHDATEDRD